MRILHTEASRGWGGQEIRILTEAAGMIARGHAVELACPPDARIFAEAPRFGEALRRQRPRRVPRLDEAPVGERGERRVDGLGARRHRPEDGGLVGVVRVRVAEGERVEVLERPGEAEHAAVPPGARLFSEMDGIGPALDAARAAGHEVVETAIDAEGYRASGLPTRTMRRSFDEDRLFFAAALAAGGALADRIGEGGA